MRSKFECIVTKTETNLSFPHLISIQRAMAIIPNPPIYFCLAVQATCQDGKHIHHQHLIGYCIRFMISTLMVAIHNPYKQQKKGMTAGHFNHYYESVCPSFRDFNHECDHLLDSCLFSFIFEKDNIKKIKTLQCYAP